MVIPLCVANNNIENLQSTNKRGNFSNNTANQNTGLGLSMIYGFIKQSGGHVAVYSEPGSGTTVKLYLPKGTDAATSGRMPDSRQRALPTGKEIILIVEDDTDVRAFLAASLGVLGYQVLEAEDGSASLALMDGTAQIDLLLTDVVLPHGMNGREIAEEARKRYPEIKVLFTSGYTDACSPRSPLAHSDPSDALRPCRLSGLQQTDTPSPAPQAR